MSLESKVSNKPQIKEDFDLLFNSIILHKTQIKEGKAFILPSLQVIETKKLCNFCRLIYWLSQFKIFHFIQNYYNYSLLQYNGFHSFGSLFPKSSIPAKRVTWRTPESPG